MLKEKKLLDATNIETLDRLLNELPTVTFYEIIFKDNDKEKPLNERMFLKLIFYINQRQKVTVGLNLFESYPINNEKERELGGLSDIDQELKKFNLNWSIVLFFLETYIKNAKQRTTMINLYDRQEADLQPEI